MICAVGVPVAGQVRGLPVGVNDDELGNDDFVNRVCFRQLFIGIPEVNPLSLVRIFKARRNGQQAEWVLCGDRRGRG